MAGSDDLDSSSRASLSKIHGTESGHVAGKSSGREWRWTKRGIIKEGEARKLDTDRVGGLGKIPGARIDGRNTKNRKRGAARDRACSPNLANRIYICRRARLDRKNRNPMKRELGSAKEREEEGGEEM